MSYINSYLDTLHNEISLDDDCFDDELHSFDEYLKVAKDESQYKDEKADQFYKQTTFKEKGDNTPLFRLSRKDLLERQSALHQNFTSSFSRRMIDKNKSMCFLTSTLSTKDRLSANQDLFYEEVVKHQYSKLHSFNNHIRYDKNIRGLNYFRINELHKKGDLHQHSLLFTHDNYKSIKNLIFVIKRAKESKDIGRCELRIPYKYKEELVKDLGLKQHGQNYYENQEVYKKGSSFIITFFQEGKDTFRDLVAYMMKYTSKSLAYSGKRSNEYYIFRKLGIRAFTYSHGVLPSLTAYQKIASKLIEKNEKYKDLYELQKDIDLGKVTFTTFYEKKEPEYKRYSFEKISSIDRSREYPIIYTYDSYHDICIFKGSYQLIAVSVSFSDKTPVTTWTVGNYEKY